MTTTLSRLEVVNWGVFDGYHSIPLSAGGALIADASALSHREEVKTFALC